MEHALDLSYARNLGVDVDELYLAQPDAGEAALGIADVLVRSRGVDVVVVDSVAALITNAELSGEMGDAHIALQARLMSQALRKLNASLASSNCLIIFINQVGIAVLRPGLHPCDLFVCVCVCVCADSKQNWCHVWVCVCECVLSERASQCGMDMLPLTLCDAKQLSLASMEPPTEVPPQSPRASLPTHSSCPLCGHHQPSGRGQ